MTPPPPHLSQGLRRSLADLARDVAGPPIEAVARFRGRRSNDVRVPFVRRYLPVGGVGAELGVFKGHFSPVLYRETNPRRLHLVDPWYLLAPAWHWGRGDRSTVNALRRILRRWRYEIETDRVVVHVGDDRQVLASFPDHYFDWVYLDSSHAYEQTRQELALLVDKVKPDGVIAGDDWQPDPSHRHHGVCRAVRELVATGDYELWCADEATQQWAIRRPRSS